MKKLNVYLILLLLCFSLVNIAGAEENPPVSEEPQMPLTEFQLPGSLEGEDTHFELKDSNYLNITLYSSEPIKLILESVPEMVTLHIEPLSEATSTQITLGGFLPSTTYYKYEDDYHNLVPFTTDGAGRYTYTQDLSKPHFIFIQPRASTIFLTKEGWSDPTVGTWDAVTRIATLTKDINQTIQIDADNITLDGEGHIITGSNTGSGIYLYRRTGVTIKNLKIQRFADGIFLYYSSINTLTGNIVSNNSDGVDLFISCNSNTLRDNTVSNNSYGILLSTCNSNTLTGNIADNNNYYGIRLYNSNSNTLTGNIANNNTHYGFYIDYNSRYNTLTGNTAANNNYGICLSRSGRNTLRDNLMYDNRYNFEEGGWSIGHPGNDIDTTNLVDGKPIYYLVGVSDIEIDSSSNAGTVYCINCDSITIRDLILTKNGNGIYFFNTYNSEIHNNQLNNNYHGINLSSSNSNTLTDNIASNNENSGIYLYYESNNNTFIDNAANNNNYGICLSYNSSGNTLTGDTASNNENYGIYLYQNSNSNTLTGNTASNNENYGIYLYNSNNNKIYNNNFIDNRTQAYVASGGGNIFNLDKPVGGNSWNDWTTPDDNGDVFVDFPYVFTGGQDNLPWVNRDGWLVVAPTTLSEKSFRQSTLTETLLSQKVNLTNVAISGDFESTLNFTDLEIISISTGPFAGKGFSRGQFETTLEGVSYKGSWQGILFFKPQERKIYLKGAVTGEILATVEGYITESIPESDIYDQYQATWKIGQLGYSITSATINLKGTLAYQCSFEYPSTELYLLQTNIEGEISGRYSGSLNTVLTHLRVLSDDNPYIGEGFSIISYASNFGSGEGWTYDKVIEPNKVELKGMFTSPLLGVASAILDETASPRTLSLIIEGIDLGLPPAPDLNVVVWGPQRISPGQTKDYIIEYRNDGLKGADNVFVSCVLDTFVKYISASSGVYYSPFAHRLSWKIGKLPAKTIGYLTFKVEVVWGLPEGFPLEQSAYIINIGE